MAEIQPLRALHYNLAVTGGLQDVVAPPYDVIDAAERARLQARSPLNVVAIDLPQGPDPYAEAGRLMEEWIADGVVVQDETPALWTLVQDYIGPDGEPRSRRGFLARVRVEPYGPGRVRPHERTHPGPKQDRLNLTRATGANLSPIFALYSDAYGAVAKALEPGFGRSPWGRATDTDGTVNRLWRIDDDNAIATVTEALRNAELLIADGHHRYETARVYAEEIGGEGPHRYVLMCLVAIQDPGLTVFPTHRLLRGLRPEQHEHLANAIRSRFSVHALDDTAQLPPPYADPLQLGYIDAHFRRPYRLTLSDQQAVDHALGGHSEAYRHLDTAVLEALILKGALGMSDDDIDQLNGLGYARDARHALELVQTAEYDLAFFTAPTPITEVQAVAMAGETMPPKSTYFYPKVPTGLLFNPLTD